MKTSVGTGLSLFKVLKINDICSRAET